MFDSGIAVPFLNGAGVIESPSPAVYNPYTMNSGAFVLSSLVGAILGVMLALSIYLSIALTIKNWDGTSPDVLSFVKVGGIAGAIAGMVCYYWLFM